MAESVKRRTAALANNSDAIELKKLLDAARTELGVIRTLANELRTDHATLKTLTDELIVDGDASVVDVAALRTAIVGITAKLDADAGVTDTDYAATWDPAAQTGTSIAASALATITAAASSEVLTA